MPGLRTVGLLGSGQFVRTDILWHVNANGTLPPIQARVCAYSPRTHREGRPPETQEAFKGNKLTRTNVLLSSPGLYMEYWVARANMTTTRVAIMKAWQVLPKSATY